MAGRTGKELYPPPACEKEGSISLARRQGALEAPGKCDGCTLLLVLLAFASLA
jgi:hypothetical protein